MIFIPSRRTYGFLEGAFLASDRLCWNFLFIIIIAPAPGRLHRAPDKSFIQISAHRSPVVDTKVMADVLEKSIQNRWKERGRRNCIESCALWSAESLSSSTQKVKQYIILRITIPVRLGRFLPGSQSLGALLQEGGRRKSRLLGPLPLRLGRKERRPRYLSQCLGGAHLDHRKPMRTRTWLGSPVPVPPRPNQRDAPNL